MGNEESLGADSAVEVVYVNDVPVGGMRLFLWGTGEIQYGCRVSGGWAMSGRLHLHELLDPIASDGPRGEILPVLEGMAEGDDHGRFEGDLIGGVIGCDDVTACAALFYDAISAARTTTRRRAPKRSR